MHLKQQDVADVLNDFLELSLSLSIVVLPPIDLRLCLIWLLIHLLTLKVVLSELPGQIDDFPQVVNIGLHHLVTQFL